MKPRNYKIKYWESPFIFFLFIAFFTGLLVYIKKPSFQMETQFPISLFLGGLIIFLTGYIVFFSYRKILESKQVESELQAIAAHQLRTPLSAFKWTLEVIERELKDMQLNDTLQHSLVKLHQSIEVMKRAIDLFLTTSRVELGGISLKKEKFSLSELTKKELFEMSEYAKAFRVGFIFNDPQISSNLTADKELISIVIKNLLDNAIRYTPPDNQITIQIQKENSSSLRWALSHPDIIGISKNEEKYIFTKFPHIHDKKSGAGLGLYISKNIIDICGGKIGFSSKDKITSFWFSLPAA